MIYSLELITSQETVSAQVKLSLYGSTWWIEFIPGLIIGFIWNDGGPSDVIYEVTPVAPTMLQTSLIGSIFSVIEKHNPNITENSPINENIKNMLDHLQSVLTERY